MSFSLNISNILIIRSYTTVQQNSAIVQHIRMLQFVLFSFVMLIFIIYISHVRYKNDKIFTKFNIQNVSRYHPDDFLKHVKSFYLLSNDYL